MSPKLSTPFENYYLNNTTKYDKNHGDSEKKIKNSIFFLRVKGWRTKHPGMRLDRLGCPCVKGETGSCLHMRRHRLVSR